MMADPAGMVKVCPTLVLVAFLKKVVKPRRYGSFSLYTQSWMKKFPLNLASSTRSALVSSAMYLGLTRTGGGGGDSAATVNN